MSCSLHDVTTLEQQGVPALAIHTQAFVTAAKAHAMARGRPDYSSAFVRHPIGGMSTEEVNARAEEVIDTVHGLLTSQE